MLIPFSKVDIGHDFYDQELKMRMVKINGSLAAFHKPCPGWVLSYSDDHLVEERSKNE